MSWARYAGAALIGLVQWEVPSGYRYSRLFLRSTPLLHSENTVEVPIMRRALGVLVCYLLLTACTAKGG